MKSFEQLATWPVPTVAAAAIGPDGVVHRYGDTTKPFALASVTKLLTAIGVHLAVEEGSILLEDVVDERGTTIADLLAHAGGLAPTGMVLDDPGMRRVYSNAGYELLGEHVALATEMSFDDYLTEGVFHPLGMATASLPGSPAFGGRASVDDLANLAVGLPNLLAQSTITTMTTPYLPELIGVLPGYGRQTPNPWGLGPEIRSTKDPHWTSADNSPETWGHFGQTGTFFWVDPAVDVTLIVLTNRDFGEWAVPLWPQFSGDLRTELAN